MHNYVYGYDIVFNSHRNDKLNTLHVSEITNIPLDKYLFKVYFQTNQNRTIYLKAKKNFTKDKSLTEWIFVVEDVVSFLCDSKSAKIFYCCDTDYSDELMRYWLIHIVLPIYFTLDNTYYFLHTGSISLNNSAILFMGDSYAGKSTLTDFFLKKGHPLVSDDKLATYDLGDRFYCHPSHPYHRPFREMETLGVKADNFFQETLAVGDIYWITPVDADKDVKIVELKALQKFKVLRYSTEMDIYVNKEKRFEYITKLANTIKVFEIEIPRDLNRLEEVYDTIIAHNKLYKET